MAGGLVQVGDVGNVHIFHPQSRLALFELIRSVRRPERTEALTRCLKVVEDAKTVVFEDEYYDLDFRSEYVTTYARDFRLPVARTTRLHFFRDHLEWAELIARAESLCTKEDESPRPQYLGYLVLRPVPEGIVGRAMLAPPLVIDGVEDFGDLIRTAVTEVVTFFGQQLRVTAVPFMQQDGGLLRCAHVTAWVCHMTSVLQKSSARVPVADFSARTGDHSASRRYPSAGLAPDDTVHLCESIGIPAATYTIAELVEQSKAQESDMALWSRRAPRQRAFGGRRRLEALTSEVCRYLNSGLPVIACIDQHQVVICGYRRRRDRSGHRIITDFIVQNDELGPYIMMKVPHRIRVTEHGRVANSRPAFSGLRANDDLRDWHQVMLPAPRGVYTTGLGAEKAGGDFAQWASTDLLSTLRKLAASDPEVLDDDVRAAISGLTDFARLSRSRRIALRSYAVQSVAFKLKFGYRLSKEGGASPADDALVELVRQLPLPKYVWVVEFMDRHVRDGDDDLPAVMGEAVVDASATPQSPQVLMVHLPGVFLLPGRTGEWTGTWPVSRESDLELDGEGASDDIRVLWVSPETRYHTGRPSMKYTLGKTVYGQSKAMGAG